MDMSSAFSIVSGNREPFPVFNTGVQGISEKHTMV